MNAAEQFLKGCTAVTSIPDSYRKLIEVLESPRCTTGIISKIISQDILLTDRLLKIVNSPLFGFPHKIKDIPQVLVILDNNRLRDIVEIISIVKSFKNETSDFLQTNDFWKYSLAIGLVSLILSNAVDKKCSERLFAAAFLYGVGRLAMATESPVKMKKAGTVSIRKQILMQEAENEIFGFDHCELGRKFLEKWDSPSSLIDISYHYHQPSRSISFKTESYLVRLAATIVQSLRIGSSGDYFVLPVLEETWTETGLKPSIIKDCASQLKPQYKPMEKALLH